MIRLFLVRHGNTFEKGETPLQVGMRTNLPLTEDGKAQAKQFGFFLQKEEIMPKGIYAGSLLRQVDSARIVAGVLGEEIFIHANEPALDEIDYGLWEGLTQEKIVEQWPHEYEAWMKQARWAVGVFGGTLEGHVDAIKKWLEILRKHYRTGDTVIGFTSNGIIRLFYSFQPEAWGEIVKKKQVETLKVKTGAFCELALYPEALEVKRWNVIPAFPQGR